MLVLFVGCRPLSHFALMAIPILVAILLLSPVVFATVRDFIKNEVVEGKS